MKLKKRIVSFAVAMLVLLSFILPGVMPCVAFVSDSITEEMITFSSNPLSRINMYKHNDVQYTISSQKKLHGFGSETYTYYQLNPTGCAILMDATGEYGLVEKT